MIHIRRIQPELGEDVRLFNLFAGYIRRHGRAPGRSARLSLANTTAEQRRTAPQTMKKKPTREDRARDQSFFHRAGVDFKLLQA